MEDIFIPFFNARQKVGQFLTSSHALLRQARIKGTSGNKSIIGKIQMKRYKITVHTPLDSADKVRAALGEAGAGRIGNYRFCSFSYQGTGRFLPGDSAKPYLGTQGEMEEVSEESIEVTLTEDLIPKVLEAIKKAHPYEEPAFEITELVDPNQFLEKKR